MSLRKAEMAQALTVWGLVVEGDESFADLEYAYRSVRDYRIANGLPWRQWRELYSLRFPVERSDIHETSSDRVDQSAA